MEFNKFHVWLQWLESLGGQYEPMRDLSEPKTHTDGRRNADLRPRAYSLDGWRYELDSKGTYRLRGHVAKAA